MGIPFRSTLRALESESTWLLSVTAVLLPCVLFSAWIAWALFARVPIYVVSSFARLEVVAEPRRAATLAAGRIIDTRVDLGQQTTAGAILMELDASMEQRRLDEARAALAGLDVRVAALREQQRAQRRVRVSLEQAHTAAAARAHVDLVQAEAESRYRIRLQEIAARWESERLVPGIEGLESEQALANSQIAVAAAEVSLSRQLADGRHASDQYVTQLTALDRDAAEIEAARETTLAAIRTAEVALEQKTIRSPVAGQVGRVAALHVGDVVQAGQEIATVIPSGRIRVAATFAPAGAIGRIHRGQTALVRLTGFSTYEFGVLRGVVANAACEPNDGAVRVELDLDPRTTSSLPIQHGLPGSVEVEVEAVRPWQLLARSVEARIHEGNGTTHPLGDY
jgi:membrane fusion protein (multidrug efflux system)